MIMDLIPVFDRANKIMTKVWSCIILFKGTFKSKDIESKHVSKIPPEIMYCIRKTIFHYYWSLVTGSKLIEYICQFSLALSPSGYYLNNKKTCFLFGG